LKYVLDILFETGFLGCKVTYTPKETNAKLLPDQGEDLYNPGRYRRLVEKLVI